MNYFRLMTRRTSAGFTLVELIATMVIIAIIAAISGPLFFNKQTFDQYGFFNETVSAVRYAQKQAIASGCVIRVNITATGYTIFRAASQPVCTAATYNAASYGTALVDLVDPNRTFTRTAPSGITLTATDLYFLPLGSLASPAVNTTVTIDNGTTQSRFRVWVVTGYVEKL